MSKASNSNILKSVRLAGFFLAFILVTVLLNTAVEAKSTPDAFLLQSAPAFSKTFSPDTIFAGNTSTLVFTLDNSGSATNASSLAFTDNLPANVIIATPSNAAVFCQEGQLLANPGESTITFNSGLAGPGATCIVTVDVTSSVAGDHVNISGDLTSSAGNSGSATDTLTVLELSDVGFSKTFVPDTINYGETTSLSFDINSESPVTGLAFTDVLPSGIIIATPSSATTDCTNATLSAPDGGTTISFSDGDLGAGSSCTVTLNVIGTGTATNVSSVLTSSNGNSPAAIAMLIVYTADPTFSKAFTPDTIGPGSTTSLHFDINYTGSAGPPNGVGGLAFSDVLPAGITIATPANATTDCTNAILSAPDGGDTINFNGGQLGDNSACSVTVNVTGTATATNISSDLTSSYGNSGPATATLTVDTDRPGFSKEFAPDTILPDDISTLTFTIDNSSSLNTVTSLDFTDILPSGVVIATPPNATDSCGEGGSVTAVAGGNTISYSGGFADPESTCTVSVDVTSAVPGEYVNISGALTSNAGTSSNATDTLIVLGISDVGFSKTFLPDAIGPGSTTQLRFDINNSGSSTQVTNLAFTDVLPAGITIATPANASTDCTGGVLSAPDGGTTISLSAGQVAPNSTCSVFVNVIGTATATNTSGNLTSSDGISGSASATLTVATNLPGFSKSFAPSSVTSGERSTLTFTIDNSANASAVANLDFSDNLPAGMLIADPANASTTCGTATLPPTLTATAGTSVIILDANGFAPSFPALAAGATCTVTVDVVATGSGTLDNVSEDLLADFVTAGKASDVLEVTITPIALTKEFSDDPTPPGDTVTLDFTIKNFDRDFSATGIAFSDDLTTLVPALAGLTFDSLLANDCGGTVSGVGGTTITFSGGTLAPGASCTVSVSLTVPAGATPGEYSNTTEAISATVDGSTVTGNMATDVLFVSPVPLLTKLFVGDPVGAGDDVVLRFTVTNTSATSMATDIEFIDELTDGSGGLPPDTTSGFLPFPVSVILPPDPCGAGSSLALVSVGTDRQGLQLTGGSLAAAPDAGSTCTFEVTVTIPVGFAAGTYTNTTEEITATVDGDTRTGKPASDDLVVVAAPTITKEFTDDPVAPGGSVTLAFTLSHSEFAPGDATGITFTDDLAALVPAIPGLTATLPPTPDPPCGPGSSLTGSFGDTLLTFAGGTLTPGEVCNFSVVLAVPDPADAGSYTNETSTVSATVLGVTATGNPASDDLQIAGLVLTKEFLDDPTLPGDIVTLRFTLDNQHPTDNATGIIFTDNLASSLSGLAAEAPLPDTSACGGSSSLSGTTFLIFSGGSVDAGTSCSFDVNVRVPAAAAAGTYRNTTGNLSATLGGSPFVGDPATDVLTVASALSLTKEFTDDPSVPGGTVTLEFALTNNNQTAGATDISFTDNLDAALTGLVAVGPLSTGTCDGTLTGTGLLTYSGGSLAPGASCIFSVTLQVPTGIPGTAVTNITSDITGTVNGVTATGDPASDQLKIDLFNFSKSFDGSTFPGGTAVLTFNIINLSSGASFSDIKFSDDLNAVVSGLAVSGPLPSNPCGAGSLLTGTSTLLMTGGNLGPGGSCTFDVMVQVPVTAVPGDYLNTTSSLILDTIEVSDPATAPLTISDETICGLTAGNTYQFTQDGVTMSIMVNSIGDLYCLTVVYTGNEHPNATDSARFEDQYWMINGTTIGGSMASGYNVAITLPQPNLFNPRVCKYPGGIGGLGWDCDDEAGTNTSATPTDVTRDNITSLSDWTVANNVGPTAVSLDNTQTTRGTFAWLVVALFLLVAGLSWFILRHKTR